MSNLPFLPANKYEELLEHSGIGIWKVDTSFTTIWVNARMAEILGYSEEEMLGRSIDYFMERSLQPAAASLKERRLAGLPDIHEFAFQHRNGSTVWTVANCSPLTGKNGVIEGSIAFITDITERKQEEVRGQLQTQILKIVAEDLPRDETLDRLIQMAADSIPHSRVGLVLLTPDNHATSARLLSLSNSQPISTSELTDRQTLCQIANLVTETQVAATDLTIPPIVLFHRPVCHTETGATELRIICRSSPSPHTRHNEQVQGIFAEALASVLSRSHSRRELHSLKAELEKQVEDRARDSARVVAALEATREGIAILEDDRFLYLNSVHAHMYGYTPSDLIGKPWTTLYEPDEAARVSKAFTTTFKTSGFWSGEARGRRRDGSTFDIEIDLTLGSSGNLVCCCRDISQRLESSRKLQRSQEQLSLIFETASDGFWDWNIQTNEVYFSARWLDMLGYGPTELPSCIETWRQLLHPDDTTFVEEAIQQNLLGGKAPFAVESRLRTNSGGWLWVLSRGRVISKDPEGRPTRAVGTHIDIQDRRIEADKLRRRGLILGSISQVQRQFLEGINPSQVFEELLDSLLEITGSQYGFIAEVVTENGIPFMRSHAITNISWNPETERLYQAAKTQGFEFRNLDTLFGHVLTTQHVVIANEASSDPRRGGLPPGHPPLNRFLGIPVLSGSTLVGVIGIANRKDPYDLVLLTEIEPLIQTYGSLIVSVRRQRDRLDAEHKLQVQTNALIESNAALRQAAQGRDEFLASVSHELRTPLASILALTEILQDPNHPALPEPHINHVRLIEESSRHLLQLINDILEVARLEARLIPIQIQPCPVLEVVDSCDRLLRTQAQKRRIRIHVHPPSPDLIALADPLRLKQILTNLITNAIKFTPSGGEVSLSVSANVESVSLSVSDSGIGIPKEKVALLFQPFVQVESGLDRCYNGSGLGLAIVKNFTDLMNGSISVESEPHVGSRFTVTLPRFVSESARTDNPPQTHRTVDATLPEPSSPPSQLLLIDDNDVNRSIISTYLSTRGFEVVAVDNGRDALKLHFASPADIIILDIQMPDMDGLEVARRIRSNPNPTISNTHIVALTALAMPGDQERCLASGISEYISKPFSLAKLTARLQAIAKSRIAGD